jgi:hypothetical protein
MHYRPNAALLTALLCIWSYVATAQYDKGFKISLPLAKYPSSDTTRLFFIDSVYTVFPDTATIGTVYRSGIGKIVPAYLKDGISQNVSMCVFSHFPQLRPTHRSVRMRIDRLLYAEDPAQGYEIEAEITFLQKPTGLGAGATLPINCCGPPQP